MSSPSARAAVRSAHKARIVPKRTRTAGTTYLTPTRSRRGGAIQRGTPVNAARSPAMMAPASSCRRHGFEALCAEHVTTLHLVVDRPAEPRRASRADRRGPTDNGYEAGLDLVGAAAILIPRWVEVKRVPTTLGSELDGPFDRGRGGPRRVDPRRRARAPPPRRHPRSRPRRVGRERLPRLPNAASLH